MLTKVILMATLSYYTGNLGFQDGKLATYDTIQECRTVARHVVQTYVAGNIHAKEPDRGHIRCVTMTGGEETAVEIIAQWPRK